MYLRDIGEDRIVRYLSERFSSPHPRLFKGIGDDASVTSQRKGYSLLATTDILIEGTHFRAHLTTPYLLGRKAAAISLSDIAAMGGSPLFFLSSVAFPRGVKMDFLDGLYRGLTDEAKEHRASLVGGNTARTQGPVMVSTTLFGEAPDKEVVYRKGAKTGDGIYVTGTPGDSALGLTVLGNHGLRASLKGPFLCPVLRHLSPAPRVEAGRELSKNRIPSAMIDVSDGLLLDLKRLLDDSARGAVIELKKLPLSSELRRYALLHGEREAFKKALTGGEDYELLFTAPDSASSGIERISSRLKLPITLIGRVTGRRTGMRVIDPKGRPFMPKKLGFEHF